MKGSVITYLKCWVEMTLSTAFSSKIFKGVMTWRIKICICTHKRGKLYNKNILQVKKKNVFKWTFISEKTSETAVHEVSKGAAVT